jgi:hypothetical protein
METNVNCGVAYVEAFFVGTRSSES